MERERERERVFNDITVAYVLFRRFSRLGYSLATGFRPSRRGEIKKKNSSHQVFEPNIRGIHEYKITNEICLFSSVERVTGTMKKKKKKKRGCFTYRDSWPSGINGLPLVFNLVDSFSVPSLCLGHV